MYPQAMKLCEQSLRLNPHDVSATHVMAHVFDDQSAAKKALDFLEETADNWEVIPQLCN